MASPNLPPRKRSLKARLHAGERLYGGFLITHAPSVAEMMGLVGYDYVIVDLEHGPGETASALPCVRALEAVGTPAIIRVGFNDQVLLKKALDLGPSGVIVPMVQNKERAEYAVACCRYPPVGIRGAQPFVRATRFGLDKSYLSTYLEDLLLICQIESAEAVDRIPEIGGVDGVDALMIGPRDLSASIGCFTDPANPRLTALIAKAEKAVLASPRKVFLKGVGRPGVDPPAALYSRGCHMVTGAMDVVLFTTAGLADIKANRPLRSASSVTSNGDVHNLSSAHSQCTQPSANGGFVNAARNLSIGGANDGSIIGELLNNDALHSNGKHGNNEDNSVHANGDLVASDTLFINGIGPVHSNGEDGIDDDNPVH